MRITLTQRLATQRKHTADLQTLLNAERERAAALLAALRLVARQHEGRVVGMGQRRCDCDVCAVVRAAIAKAEGKS